MYLSIYLSIYLYMYICVNTYIYLVYIQAGVGFSAASDLEKALMQINQSALVEQVLTSPNPNPNMS